jgi:hypothetical protein
MNIDTSFINEKNTGNNFEFSENIALNLLETLKIPRKCLGIPFCLFVFIFSLPTPRSKLLRLWQHHLDIQAQS